MTDQNDHPCVIVIDDNRDHLDLIAGLIERGTANGSISVSLPVRTYLDPAEALAEMQTLGAVLTLLDYHLNDGTGLDWLSEIVRRSGGPVILVTEEGGVEVVSEGFRNGVKDYLSKSRILEDPTRLYSAIRRAIRLHRVDLHNIEAGRRLIDANESLKLRVEQMRQLTETAHRFVDDVAHEFRNPLTVIQISASNIEDGIAGPVSDSQREYLGNIGNATRDLTHLIDDFLDSSRLKSGSLRIDRRHHTVDSLFTAVRSNLKARAQASNITVRESIAPGLPEVFCDLERAGRALVNFAVNAIKFSPDGGVVEIAADHHRGGGVVVTVKDQGPGIMEEDLQKIRNRFSQAEAQASGRVKGYGLGLSIAEDLIRLNFGRMEIESVPGVGSSFAFTLCNDNPRQIVQRYLATLFEQSFVPVMSVIEALPAAMPQDLDAIREFVSSVCFPMDLVLAKPGGDSLLLIGACSNPNKWISRLHAEHQAERTPRLKSAEFKLRPVGTWKRPELEHALIQCVEGGFSVPPSAV